MREAALGCLSVVTMCALLFWSCGSRLPDIPLDAVLPAGSVSVEALDGISVWQTRTSHVSFDTRAPIPGAAYWSPGSSGSSGHLSVRVMRDGSPLISRLMHRQLHGRVFELSAYVDEPTSEPKAVGGVMGDRVSREELVCGSGGSPCDTWFYKAQIGQYRFVVRLEPSVGETVDLEEARSTIEGVMEAMLANLGSTQGGS